MRLFVPGRLCLLGEHSDWAGGYRCQNSSLEKGYTLLTGTNQGIYAEVRPHSSHLILKTTLTDGTRLDSFVCPMEEYLLLAEAQKGDFFSYGAGVAYQCLKYYQVGGLEIDNYFTDLPLQKGLSSSAAFCVLVARAFHQVYDLKMTRRGEMELAYLGEITTPSRCGRMDQACAYGNRPILMIFDGDDMEVKPLNPVQDLFFVLVDLGRKKNTQLILDSLHQCYPIARNEIAQNVQNYLGKISANLTQEAAEALERGDGKLLGKLMTLAQREFDRNIVPACSSELLAPVLHELLNYQPIQPYILGGKGVGSQGDGTAQFVVKDAPSQEKVMEIIERDFPEMKAFKLTIYAQKRVRKAVIPAAGFGTRMFPCTKIMKKELFPIVDRDGKAKPVLLVIIEEALRGGIEEIGVVIQSRDRDLFENFFMGDPSPELYQKLSAENRQYLEYLKEIGKKITWLIQEEQEGFGHAIFAAANWVNNEPFLLMLGDHIYQSLTPVSCVGQLLSIYQEQGKSVIGLRKTPGSQIHYYGCVKGDFMDNSQDLLSLRLLYEKPTLEYAQQYLKIDNLGENTFFSVFGLYVLTPRIFDYLAEKIQENQREKGEFQLTSSLERLREEEGMIGYWVKGECFDTGLPQTYQQTLRDFTGVMGEN